MSTTLAARAARQTLILATIGGLHLGALIVIGMGLDQNFGLPALPPPAITLLVPPLPTTPLIEPGPLPDPEYGNPQAPMPVLEFPRFEERSDPTPGIEVTSGIAGMPVGGVNTNEPADVC